MDGVQYDFDANPKPPKDWNERLNQTATLLNKGAAVATENLSVAGSVLATKSKEYGTVISEKSKVAGSVIYEKSKVAGAVIAEKTGTLKEKIQTKEYGQKLMSMFGKKKPEN